MKGSMLLSMITLCVVMLFTADRIKTFLHGPAPSGPPAVQRPSEPAIDWAGLWQSFSDLFSGKPPAENAPSGGEAVVINEDTLYSAWVWTGTGGELRSASVDPGNSLARKVLIPKGMTVEAFFSPTAAARPADTGPSPQADKGNTASREDRPGPANAVDPQAMARQLADGEPMTEEERRRFIREGMRLFREHRDTLQARP